MPSVGEIFVELGIVANDDQIKQAEKKLKVVGEKAKKATSKIDELNKSFNKFKKTIGLGGIVAGIIATTKQVDNFVKSLTSANQEMLNLTRTSNISLDTFQKWGSVGKLFGIQNAAQQMAGLNERLFELKLTGQGAKGFQLAGINPMGTDAQGVLEQLRNRVSGVDDTTASYLLKQLGLDPSMLHILRLGREEFENLWKTINRYQLNDDQRKEIQELNKQLQIAAQKLQYLKDRAILAIMPAWTKFVASLARVTEGLARIAKWIQKGVDWFLLADTTIAQLTRTVTAFAGALWLIAKHPVFTVLSGLYLLIDEIMAYMNGGGSLIGVFLYDLEQSFKKLSAPDTSGIDKMISSFKVMQTMPIPPVIKAYLRLLEWSAEKGAELNVNQNLTSALIPPRTLAYATTYNYDNRQVQQNNQIHTTQTAQSVNDSLVFANAAFA